MSWSIIGVNKWVSIASDGTSPTGTKAWPAAATTTGDLGLMVLVYRGTASPSVHADWTLIQSSTSAETASQEQCTIHTYRHVYAGTAPNMTWVTPTLHSAVITAYRHSSETTYTYGTAAVGVNSDAGSASHTLSGGVSSAGADALVVAFMGNGRGQGYADVNAVTPSTGSGATAVTTAPSSSAWYYRGHEGAISSTAFAAAMADAVLGSGSTGTITAVAGAPTRGTVIAISIKPGTVAAPVLSVPTATATGPTQATIGVTSDTAPTATTISYQILPAASGAPSAATIVGAPDGTITTGSAGALTKAITGLTTNTAVKVHFAQGASSNVVSSASFTPQTLASSGSPSAQTGTAGGSITWAGATPNSLLTNTGNGSGAWSIVSSAGFTVAPSINTSTGVLSGGTLSSAGTYAPQIRYTDSSTVPSAQTVTFTLSLTVSAAGGVTFTGTVPAQSGTVGTAFSLALASYFSGTGTYEVQAGTLPPGLARDINTGAITGTPTTAGTYSGVVIRKTAASGSPATADTNAFAFTIAAAPAVAGFDLDTAAGCVFGSVAGSLTSISREVSVAYKVAVYNTSTRALIFESASLTTNSAGRLPRFTTGLCTIGVTYDLVAKRVSDGAIACFRLAAT